MNGSAITPLAAASALGELRQARESVNLRASGLSLIVWALVFVAMASSLLAYSLARFMIWRETGQDPGPVGWIIFLMSSVALVAVWAGVGAVVQGVVRRSFTVIPPSRGVQWKRPLLAFAASFLALAANWFGQGIGNVLAGATAEAERLNNMGIAMALWIAASLWLGILLVQDRTVPRRAGLTVAVAGMLLGHLVRFPWIPDLGSAGLVAAALALPVALVSYGLYLWNQG